MDAHNVTVNGRNKKLEPTSNNVVVTIKNNRTVVLLRFFSETLGYDVKYNALVKIVYITRSNGDTQKPDVDKKVIYKSNMKPEDFILGSR